MLNDSVLVLNRGYIAIQITNVKRAVALLYTGHAKAVDADYYSYDFEAWKERSNDIPYEKGEFVRSISYQLKAPRVITLTKYDKLPMSMVKFSRKNVFERDRFQCQYCGAKKPSGMPKYDWVRHLTIDHVTPRALGGKSVWTNVVCACGKCNGKKADRVLETIQDMDLLSKPSVPRWKPLEGGLFSKIKHDEWSKFLNIAGG